MPNVRGRAMSSGARLGGGRRAAGRGSALTTALRVTRYVVQVTVAAVAVAAATLLVGPKALGWQGVIVLTGSMEPALQTGGVAFVDPVKPEDVGVGDILTFTRPNSDQQVTHRVIEVVGTTTGPRFRTKGDANDAPDGWVVTGEQVVGKVRLALPHLGGFAELVVGNRRALGLAMAVPALYLIVDDIRRSRAKRREKNHTAPPPPAPPVPAPVPEPLVVSMATRPRRTRAVPGGVASSTPAPRRPRPLRPDAAAAAPLAATGSPGPSARAHRVAAGVAVGIPLLVTMVAAYDANRHTRRAH